MQLLMLVLTDVVHDIIHLYVSVRNAHVKDPRNYIYKSSIHYF